MSTDFNVKAAQCPGCGAPIGFSVGMSRMVVCEHCKFVVARTDRGLETVGKVADLVPTGAKLTLGIEGRLQGAGFRVVGRTQLQWAQGVWDEWYVAFENGRWGWLAEAQGRYYLSFPAPDHPVPPWSALRPGKEVALGELGRFVASDLKRAKYVTAMGELPEAIPLDGQNIRTADLTGHGSAFATLDYGVEGDEADVYIGREVAFESLNLDPNRLAAPPKQDRIKAQKLTCPTCNGPLELKAPDDAMRVTCPHCAALLDCTQGKLEHLAQLKKRSPDLKLGSVSTLQGVEWMVIGWVERRCTVEGVDYFWEEYLLYDKKTAGYRFLVNSAGHWSFVSPVPAGEITETVRGALWNGKLYRTFSQVTADVTGVMGEFYWAVALGESVQATDYVAPPEGLSQEQSPEEVNWSHAVYLPPQALSAFKLVPRPPSGVGMMQPNPWDERTKGQFAWLAIGVAAAIGLFVFFSARNSQVVFDQTYTPVARTAEGPSESMAADQDVATPGGGAVRVTAPFKIESGARNLQVEMTTTADNTFMGVAGALVNQTTNEVDEFYVEAGYYHGVDDGESWSEGSREDTAYLSSVPAGTYVLRLETVWEAGKPPPSVHLKLTSGVARLLHLLLVIGAMVLVPLFAAWRSSSFEKARWEESNLDGGGED